MNAAEMTTASGAGTRRQISLGGSTGHSRHRRHGALVSSP